MKEKNIRIKITGTDLEKMNEFINNIKMIADKMGIKIKGPIPLPTRRLRVILRKSPHGRGSITFSKYEMRIHKRIIEIKHTDIRILKHIMRLDIPNNVKLEIKI